jgi:aspartyl-tRNA(Asn)/glutamyl-tRNA(Gln) amidotransferase subunit A
MNDKKISSVEVVKSYLERIEQVEKKVKAFITILPEDALRDAREIDARRHRGEKLHPLAGVPVAVKDNICTRGIETTCGSRILKGYMQRRPDMDA